jgi:hypothetical protein
MKTREIRTKGLLTQIVLQGGKGVLRERLILDDPKN